MPRRILVDAIHPEKKRVVILEDGRILEFDSETLLKKQVKGNVYLAKVTRVEPSLQAAFVDYGGDRHGFLPFSEIHPDYYQIPVTDKKELIDSMREARKAITAEAEAKEDKEEQKLKENGDEEAEDDSGEVGGSEEEEFASDDFSKTVFGKYKIQEVIKRGQIFLVQVEKEERGNKGASLTTYISMAGRYCVLMPNARRRGGVSRRISSFEDRKRLKNVVKGLKLPDEANIIIRTAGGGKSEKEIHNDYNYLANLWNTIREKTLSSQAPSLVYIEDDILRRTVRDLYSDEVDEILIEGKQAYDDMIKFMKQVAPEACVKVKEYKNKIPVFRRYKVEEQISEFYQPEAKLESGGSLVINPTEALISIDVNSGKSTSQRDVEETALSTNLEAAVEVARQLKLRDLSGLIVVDFIDMLEYKNRRAVERKLRSAFHTDRAKVQIGRISTFGLLEMSRQRLRPSFYDVNTIACQKCKGLGVVRAVEVVSAMVLQSIESEISGKHTKEIYEVLVQPDVALHILNHKREDLSQIEAEHNTKLVLKPDNTIEDETSFIICEEGEEDKNENQYRDNYDKEKRSPGNRKNTKPRRRERSRKGGKFSAKTSNQDDKGSIITGLWKKIIE